MNPAWAPSGTEGLSTEQDISGFRRPGFQADLDNKYLGNDRLL